MLVKWKRINFSELCMIVAPVLADHDAVFQDIN